MTTRVLAAARLIALPLKEWGIVMLIFLGLIAAAVGLIAVLLAASYPLSWAWHTTAAQSLYHQQEAWHVAEAVGLTILLCRPPHH